MDDDAAAAEIAPELQQLKTESGLVASQRDWLSLLRHLRDQVDEFDRQVGLEQVRRPWCPFWRPF
eukprot:COSAG01_NODE_601_length_14954_cov_175.954359_3_plen_65_part_00